MTVVTDGDAAVLEAYGMQREVCLRAGRDADNHPVASPLDNGGFVYRIRGSLDRARLLAAVDLVTAGMDALWARLRWGGDRYLLVPDGGPTSVPVCVVDLRHPSSDRRQELLRAVLARSSALVGDLRDGPLAVFVLARLAADDHVLSMEIDHSVADRLSNMMTARLVSSVYGRLAEGDEDGAVAEATVPSFLRFAREAQRDTARVAATARFWQRAVEPPPFSAVMPGCRWRSWRERRSTERVARVVPPRTHAALRQATEVTGAPMNYLYYAAVTIVLAAVENRDFVPITFARHGRTPAVARMQAPLWESPITVAPADGHEQLGGWVAAFAEVNMGSPALGTFNLVDVASLDRIMEYRRVTINVWLPFSPMRFGALDGHSIDVPPPPTYRPPRIPHNIGIRLMVEGIDRITVLLHHDPQDLASGELFLDAVHRVLELTARHPTMSVAEARRTADAVLRGAA
ncbi:condensation domain-containing protein [Micromonospora sp. LOL_024]|uniref:condensation domain-containing protein n=1 Tax=Micromonospora sp. LOL_024 TaxID=3345412 RepID=UPI003A8BA2AD